MNNKVTVIDYGIGNVFSVCNALLQIGASPLLTNNPKQIQDSDRVVLPGVGAFAVAIKNLKEKKIDEAILKLITKERPFLGICVGMQLLMETSNEMGEHKGLGIISGKVDKISNSFPNNKKNKVPHIGWAKILKKNLTSHLSNIIIDPQIDNNYFYFVHSYSCYPSAKDNVIATLDYNGVNLVAAIGFKNVLGVQFHPERSGLAGLSLLDRFMKI